MKNILLINFLAVLSGSAIGMLNEEEQIARALSISEKEAKERTQELEDLRKALEISGQEAQERKQQQEQADYVIAQNLAREFAKEGQFIEKKVAPIAQEPEQMESEANELIEQELDVWEQLPEELKVHILTYLPYETLAKIITSKLYNRLALDPMVMRQFIKKLIEKDMLKASKALANLINKGTNRELVEIFLQEGLVDVFVSKNLMTPLMLAAQRGNLALVSLILKYGGKVNEQRTFGGLTPLIFAAANGHRDVVELLLKKGADVNGWDYEYLTPTYWAELRGHKDIVQLLSSHGGTRLIMGT